MPIEPRELALAAISDTFSSQRTELMKNAELPAVASTLDHYRSTMRPMSKLSPENEAKARATIYRSIGSIGAKLAPTMTPSQAEEWAKGIFESLSKWPYRVANEAAQLGVSEPFRYGIRDVDARLHELAAEIADRHQTAIWRLEKMEQELRAALNPTPAIEHQPKLWTQADIDDANQTFRKLGIKTRYRLNGTEADGFELTEEEADAERKGDDLTPP